MTLVQRVGTAPAWAKVLALYAVSRVLTSGVLLTVFLVASGQGMTFASPRRDPSFFTFSGSWDASSYRTIALEGYPIDLPLDGAGHVVSNVWAFLPVYPWLARMLMGVTGLDFYTAGVIISTLFGGAAAFALYRLLGSRVGDRAALWAVALFCFGPMSFVLQVAYAESLFLFLLFCALIAMVERNYLVMIPFGVVAAFTRPGGLAVALALAVIFVMRIVRREPFPLREKIGVVAAGLSIAAAGLAWPVIADAVTGHPGAYIETELSWWVGFIGRQHLVPLTPWFIMGATWLGVLGVVLVLIVVAIFVWWMLRRRLRELGPDLLAYSASYGVYLFAVFLPQESILRLMLPFAPLLGDPAISRSPALRRTLLIAGVALQPVAVVLLWFLAYP